MWLLPRCGKGVRGKGGKEQGSGPGQPSPCPALSGSGASWCPPPVLSGSRLLAGLRHWGSLSQAVVLPLRLLFPLPCRLTLQPALPPPSPPLLRRPVTPSHLAPGPAQPPCSGSPPPRHLPLTPSVSVQGWWGGVMLCCGWCRGAGVRGDRTLSPVSRAGASILLHVIKHVDHGQRVHLCAITTYLTANAFLAGSDPLEVVCQCAELFAMGVRGGAGVLSGDRSFSLTSCYFSVAV